MIVDNDKDDFDADADDNDGDKPKEFDGEEFEQEAGIDLWVSSQLTEIKSFPLR
ncbi:hypothetical protein ACLOJK_019094 [Asimina triloba]